MKNFKISGKIFDLFNERIYGGTVHIKDGVVEQIEPANDVPHRFIMPGLIDAHVHIESSMLTPSRFARMVVPHGTIGVVTDPHEIANVLGGEGVQFMINDGKKVPFKFFFGAPSCVPATAFETSGTQLDANAVQTLLESEDVFLLSEMMNFPGVIHKDPQVMEKLSAAKRLNKRIDGHAPGLTGDDLKKYVDAGVETDHECAFLHEALEKISLGMKIQIREGSAARNFKNLAPLLSQHPDKVMLCTDDSHPDEILNHGHIDKIIRLGLKMGYNLFPLLRAATINPVMHYNLPVGLLRPGDSADFIVVNSLDTFDVEQTYINGQCVFDKGKGVQFPLTPVTAINVFRKEPVSGSQLRVVMPADKNQVKVIEVEDGELLTGSGRWTPTLSGDREVNSDSLSDVLKLVVVNRYNNTPPSVGFVRNFRLKSGALASSVAHDSHNIVAVGTDDQLLEQAINGLIESGGGIIAVKQDETHLLSLPVAGLISLEEGQEVAWRYQQLNEAAREMGTKLQAPFMTLSFLSLLVIPSLKLGDRGLFDVNTFSFTSLFE